MIDLRIAALREQRSELVANVNALDGAIQMNEEWLVVLDQTPPVPETTPPSV